MHDQNMDADDVWNRKFGNERKPEQISILKDDMFGRDIGSKGIGK